jgi:hypothetical protein
MVLRDILTEVRMVDSGVMEMTLSCEPGKTVRPREVLKQIFGLNEETLSEVGIRKLSKRSRPPST